jgi:hypothetical protein
VPAWELAERIGMDIPRGAHWLDWYLSALNGESEHEDWKARRQERLASQGGGKGAR